MTDQAMIRFERPDADGGGDFKVLVGGRKVGTLGSGDKLFVSLPAGEHMVAVRFFWISSEPMQLSLTAGQHLRIQAERAFGFGPFDTRYFSQRHSAIRLSQPTGGTPDIDPAPDAEGWTSR